MAGTRGTLPVVECAGMLLTGGSSSRMGRDKAMIVVDGKTLAVRAAGALAAVAAPCIEVGPGVSGLPAVQEEPAGGGPLAAVAAGASAMEAGLATLVVACDLPWLSSDVLRWLASHPSAGSVVPLWEARPQPLCARWSPAALATAIALVGEGARSMQALLHRADAVLVEPPEHLARALADVDTPEQLAEVPGVHS